MEAYVMRGPRCAAADIMTRKGVWVIEFDSIGRAVWRGEIHRADRA